MSVYIQGMEMPDFGYVCLKVFANGDVFMTKMKRGALVVTGINERIGTAIPVPEHGRCIDVDVLIKVLKTKAKNPLNQEIAPYSWAFAYECEADSVKDMPTIIPADKEEL